MRGSRPLRAHLLVGAVVSILLTGFVGTPAASGQTVSRHSPISLRRAQLALRARELNSELRTALDRGMTLTPLAQRYFSANSLKKLAMIQLLQPDGRSSAVTLATGPGDGSPASPNSYVGPGPQQFTFSCWCDYGVTGHVYWYVNWGSQYVDWYDVNVLGTNRTTEGPTTWCPDTECLVLSNHYPGSSWHVAGGTAYSTDGAWVDYAYCG